MSRLAATLAAVLLLAACGDAKAGPPRPDTGVRAVAATFPLAWTAQRVAPDARHTFLASGGGDAHDPGLSPRDRAAIEGADVVLYMGELDLQPQVEAALATREGITVSARAAAGEDALLGIGDGGDARADPHLWFSPAIMARVADATGEAFAAADPSGAAGYRRRAAEVAAELRALDGDLDALLSGCAHRTAVVSHEAYAYLLHPRGLSQEGVSGTGGHDTASPRRLAELVGRIRDMGLPAVLAEPVEGRADAEALAREAGVPLIEIDPLERVDAQALEAGYPALLRRQAEAFARALGCP